MVQSLCSTVDCFLKLHLQFLRVRGDVKHCEHFHMLNQECFYVCVQLDSLRLDSGKSQLTEHIIYLEEQLQKHRLHVEQSTAVRQMKAQVCHLCGKEHVLKVICVPHTHLCRPAQIHTHTHTNKCVCVCVHMNAHITTFFFVSFPGTNAVAI
jgi:hypothetical protein